MTDISAHYAQFGAAVIDAVKVEINRHGSLKELLQRLNEPVPEAIDEQHHALRKFVHRYGPLFFMTVAKSDWTREQVERMKDNVRAGVDTSVGKLRAVKPAPAAVPPKPTTNIVPPETTAAKRIYPSERKPIVQPRSPYSAPTRERRRSNTPAPSDHPNRRASDGQARRASDGPRQMINTATYSGPDRRTLEDRRSGLPDRRSKIDVVFKNQRFGGRDRRKTVRRAADREKLKNSPGS
jgi:hypothetical protein